MPRQEDGARCASTRRTLLPPPGQPDSRAALRTEALNTTCQPNPRQTRLNPALYSPGTVFSLNGAHIGDMFMSLILTCRFCGVAPFNYLLTLRHYAKQLAQDPAAWMPWNYQSTLATFAGG